MSWGPVGVGGGGNFEAFLEGFEDGGLKSCFSVEVCTELRAPSFGQVRHAMLPQFATRQIQFNNNLTHSIQTEYAENTQECKRTFISFNR